LLVSRIVGESAVKRRAPGVQQDSTQCGGF
jgi:hypothetical protein